ncbi:hypothetical protein YC2023_105291 [Brassica napus]
MVERFTENKQKLGIRESKRIILCLSYAYILPKLFMHILQEIDLTDCYGVNDRDLKVSESSKVETWPLHKYLRQRDVSYRFQMFQASRT